MLEWISQLRDNVSGFPGCAMHAVRCAATGTVLLRFFMLASLFVRNKFDSLCFCA